MAVKDDKAQNTHKIKETDNPSMLTKKSGSAVGGSLTPTNIQDTAGVGITDTAAVQIQDTGQ